MKQNIKFTPVGVACEAIKKLDNMADLNIFIRQLKLTKKALKAQAAQEAKSTFSVGDTVNINTKKGVLKGVITKMNRTRAVCDINDSSFNVPFSLMEVA